MSSQLPSPFEQQIIINQLMVMNLQPSEWRGLARSINQNPGDVYGEGTTNPDKAEAIVSTAVRHGVIDDLSSAIAQLRALSVTTQQLSVSKLDTKIAYEVGALYSALLEQLDIINAFSGGDETVDDNANTEDFTEFHEKLRDKAKFSIDNQLLAVDSKNDNSVLKRKASKLGYDDKFSPLNKKIRVFYSKQILVKYPPEKYNADYRLNKFVDELYSILPNSFQTRDDILDHIYGVIFDATFQCLIFNQ